MEVTKEVHTLAGGGMGSGSGSKKPPSTTNNPADDWESHRYFNPRQDHFQNGQDDSSSGSKYKQGRMF